MLSRSLGPAQTQGRWDWHGRILSDRTGSESGFEPRLARQLVAKIASRAASANVRCADGVLAHMKREHSVGVDAGTDRP
jgi:hypothetical protein